MPCTFSGIFFVHSINSILLNCTFKDEYGDIRQPSITHFDNNTNRMGPHPTAAPYLDQGQGHVYIFTGPFYIVNDDFLNPTVLHSYSYHADWSL
jgi:hypothetical protein